MRQRGRKKRPRPGYSLCGVQENAPCALLPAYADRGLNARTSSRASVPELGHQVIPLGFTRPPAYVPADAVVKPPGRPVLWISPETPPACILTRQDRRGSLPWSSSPPTAPSPKFVVWRLRARTGWLFGTGSRPAGPLGPPGPCGEKTPRRRPFPKKPTQQRGLDFRPPTAHAVRGGNR